MNFEDCFKTRPVEKPKGNLRDLFKPEEHGLSKDFLLTNYSDLKG